MRKQTKLAVVLSAAALLAIGASMTSFAARGWQQEDGEWVYLDSDGERVTEEWKSSNGNYYWLDDDGWMARNQLVDDGDYTYYVNEDGVRVKNQWRSVENEDGEDVNGEEPDVLWYYFGDTGRAYYASDNDLVRKQIGGKYYFFDGDGHMAFGWIQDYDGDTYYCGDENEGWAYTGWQYLEPDDDIADDNYDDMEWFNFKSSGKARKGSPTKTAYIGGRYYTFDENGVCLDDWILDFSATNSNGPVDATDGLQYASIDGTKGTGWVYTEDPDEDDVYWYYLVSVNDVKGTQRSVAFNSYNGDDLYRAKVIKSKTYIFCGDGTMDDGRIEIVAEKSEGSGVGEDGRTANAPYPFKEDGKTAKTKDNANIACKYLESGWYYFNDSVSDTAAQRGQMATGKTTVTDDGETYHYYFNKSTGRAYANALIDNVVYGPDGDRVEADDGNSNMIYNVDEPIYNAAGESIVIAKDSEIIVSSTGKLRKSGTVKVDGIYYDVEVETTDDGPLYKAVYNEKKND